MRYLMIGDSWGCGEWQKEFSDKDEHPGIGWFPSLKHRWHRSYIVPNTHAGVYLAEHGHSFTNLCKGGDSNINQLKQLADHLQTDSGYDYIIWFYTEPVRDWRYQNYQMSDSFYKQQLLHQFGYDNILDTWHSVTYSMADAIYKQHKIPYIMIGGMSPLPDNAHHHSFITYYIRDWANEMILDRYCEHPYNPSQFCHFIEIYIDHMDKDRALSEVKAGNDWIETCCVHPNFPDWGHPDRNCHSRLADWIHSNSGGKIVNIL